MFQVFLSGMIQLGTLEVGLIPDMGVDFTIASLADFKGIKIRVPKTVAPLRRVLQAIPSVRISSICFTSRV